MVLEDEPHLPVAERGQLGLGQGERVAAVERHRPAGRRLERAEDVEQRALPAAGGTHHGDRLPALKVERNARQHRKRPAG